MRSTFIEVTCVLTLACFGLSASLASEEPSAPDRSTWDQVLQMYEKAKEAGEQVPQDVYQWAKDDLSKIGDWEYFVAEISLSDPESLQKQLNVLGAERWECVWIHNSDGKSLFVFKRPTKSYLKNVPLSQLMKLVPGRDSPDE